MHHLRGCGGLLEHVSQLHADDDQETGGEAEVKEVAEGVPAGHIVYAVRRFTILERE